MKVSDKALLVLSWYVKLFIIVLTIIMQYSMSCRHCCMQLISRTMNVPGLTPAFVANCVCVTVCKLSVLASVF